VVIRNVRINTIVCPSVIHVRAMYKLVSAVGIRTLHVSAAVPTVRNDTGVIRPIDDYRTATVEGGRATGGSMHTRRWLMAGNLCRWMTGSRGGREPSRPRVGRHRVDGVGAPHVGCWRASRACCAPGTIGSDVVRRDPVGTRRSRRRARAGTGYNRRSACHAGCRCRSARCNRRSCWCAGRSAGHNRPSPRCGCWPGRRRCRFRRGRLGWRRRLLRCSSGCRRTERSQDQHKTSSAELCSGFGTMRVSQDNSPLRAWT
jgi:hypothetical protein